MRKKCFVFAAISMAISLAIYAFTYCLYHYLGPDKKFRRTFQRKPAKPLVTLYFGIWGVLHQFAAVTGFLAGLIFFPGEKRK